jgi:hypothetical protein
MIPDWTLTALTLSAGYAVALTGWLVGLWGRMTMPMGEST